MLVIDDDLSLREMMEMLLRAAGYEVSLAENGCLGLEMACANRFDAIVSDIKMPKLSGLEVLKKLRGLGHQTPLILVSAYARPDAAVEAMREGAYDFIPKPFKAQDLLAVVDSALAHQNIEQERQALIDTIMHSQKFGRLVGTSPPMLHVYDLIKKAGQTNTSILITGESGTGKELVAQAVHENSIRAEGEFVAINCGGMPETLVESELFGYKKGAFTGANHDKQGLVAMAHGGTLFLDELGELPLTTQVKLLRVLQEKTYRPVGGTVEEHSDLRFISATNKNLEAEIMSGHFREDLYYRINVINIHLPPLRERGADVHLLAHFFLEKYSALQNKNVRKLSAYALDILSRYSFPGNVRELENIIERSVALEQSNIILPESLRLTELNRQAPISSTPKFAAASKGSIFTAPENQPPQASRPRFDYHQEKLSLSDLPPGGIDELLATLESYYLYQALYATSGIKGQAAIMLSISPWRLRARLAAYDLSDLSPLMLAKMPGESFPKPNLPNHLAPDWQSEGLNLDGTLLAVEKFFISEALAIASGNKTEASTLLGLSRRSFQHRLDKTALG
ncbi:MAG: sigma 54-interacting transcriptional regulator [Candidatus Adiutrix sp.]